MGTHKRRMKPYYPRKPRQKSPAIDKQQLKDLEGKIAMPTGSYLVLREQGNPQQAEIAKQRAKSSLHKYGPDMQKIATRLSEELAKLVEQFMNSVEGIVLSASSWVDEGKISSYYEATQKLEEHLAA